MTGCLGMGQEEDLAGTREDGKSRSDHDGVGSRRTREWVEEDPEEARKRRLMVIPLVMGAAAIVGCVFFFVRGTGVYSRPVGDLADAGGALTGKAVRVEGTFVRGTLTMRADPCEHRFRVRGENAEVQVHYPHCTVPDGLHDTSDQVIKVFVAGKLQADGVLLASEVSTQCPTRYDKDQKEEKKMPGLTTR
jgi:cytochrome c-type biogenesis protein CcmE